MPDESVATVQNLLRDQRAPLVENLRWATVILSEVERDGRPESFDGEMVKVPIILAPQQGVGFATEAGILNAPRTLSHNKVRIDSGIAHVTVSFTTKAAAAAKGGDNSWIDLIPDKMRMAEEAMRRTINESFCGNGDALLASFTASVTSATHTLGSINYYPLYAERYVDVVHRTTGAVLASGVKINSVDEDAGTITFDQSITVTNAYGIYMEGSYGNAIAGWGQATAITGTFQTLDKGSVQGWQGTQIKAGASASALADLTLGVMAKAERRSRQRSGSTPDFYLFDPAVLDKYELLLSAQARYGAETGTLTSGWTGIKYRGKVLIAEDDMPANTGFGIYKEDVRIYTRDDGPDWDERDGSMFKRFARALPFEAWLVWMLQLGFKRCNSQVAVQFCRRAA